MEKEFNFEKSLSRLEEIVSILEKGEVSLDESLSLYEEGVSLSVALQNKLKDVEEKTIKVFDSLKPKSLENE
ncbi:MAG: exodeoxyribonuclease VII small subunit [Erysipelotrichaceae bacterium]|nr:exodeoxyribonuclease VII small subunit [Erysipelotrichaceae bacterium]